MAMNGRMWATREALDRPHDDARDRQNDERRNDSLNRARDDFLTGDERRRHRSEQPVLDLARPTEVLNHRQRDGLHRRQREAHSDDSGQQRRRVAAAHEAHLRQEKPEDDDEQYGLHERANEEVRQLAASDAQISTQESTEHGGGRDVTFAVGVRRVRLLASFSGGAWALPSIELPPRERDEQRLEARRREIDVAHAATLCLGRANQCGE